MWWGRGQGQRAQSFPQASRASQPLPLSLLPVFVELPPLRLEATDQQVAVGQERDRAPLVRAPFLGEGEQRPKLPKSRGGGGRGQSC